MTQVSSKDITQQMWDINPTEIYGIALSFIRIVPQPGVSGTVANHIHLVGDYVNNRLASVSALQEVR